MDHVLSNKDSPVPRFDSGGIHRGYRVIKCMDLFSREFLSNCVTTISNAWDGLSLKLIPAAEIPLRPRARIWLPRMKTMDNHRLLECLKLQNPTVPMDDWSVIRAEEPRDNSMSYILAISEQGKLEIEKAGNKLFFGVREAKVKVFRPSGSADGKDELDDANQLLMGMQLKVVQIKTLKVVQINLQHSRNATDNLRVLLAEEGLDICIIQEPWVYDSMVKGFQDAPYNILYINKGKPRTCLLAKKNIKIFLCTQFSTADLTVARVELTDDRSIIIASCYMAHDRPSPPEEVEHLLSSTVAGDVIILGCDANARHTIWGSTMINERGESFLDFININNLTICNSGTNQTFLFPSSVNYNG